ncbi:nitroreductase [Nocardia sp. XZ_19_385]|uniref:nitroreductase n=1 Tax=Nocardia sp. XZ_19_385 TaxID=2769488 RepID=UPI00189047C9|nr:nitroreductase [Nocardia sp. XZ_19_385]
MNIEAVRALEPTFCRAPSAHNTQPWTLTYRDDHVEIGWEPDRALPVSDSGARDLMMSLGAFVESCLIACADSGLAIAFESDPADRRIGRLVAAPVTYETPYSSDDLHRRTTHRGRYRPGPLSKTLRSRLTGIANAAHAELRFLPCDAASSLVRQADRHLFSTPPVVRELRDWLRLTPHHPRYRRDGLTAAALGLTRFESRGLRVALTGYPVLRPLGLPRLLAAQTRFDDDGELFVLIADPADPIEAGRVLLRIWLELSRHDHTTHPLSQIIDCPATRADLGDLLGIADPDSMLHIARAGRPATLPAPSFRRPAGGFPAN